MAKKKKQPTSPPSDVTDAPYPLPSLQPALIVVVVSFSVYIKSICPTIAGGDAGEAEAGKRVTRFHVRFYPSFPTPAAILPSPLEGELVAEGCQLGTAHPPGYPLFTIITYALKEAFGGYGRPAFIMNCFSAICGSVQAGLVTFITMLLMPKLETNAKAAIGLACGLGSAFSPLAWQYHVTAEVFALNNVLVALITLCLSMYAAVRADRWMYLGAWLCGVGLTNQHTCILLEVPAILYMIYAGDLLKNTGKLGKCASCFLVGFSSYATMPVFAVLYPHRGSWGDVTTLTGLVRHFRRADYGSLQLYSGDASTAEGLDER
jgi:hypothetical protein